jgi:DUF971 family protein
MGHEPIQFVRTSAGAEVANEEAGVRPLELDLKRDSALTVRWSDGRISIYPVAYLRKMSPSADARALREEMKSNPLTVLPSTPSAGPLAAVDAELVGNYALRIRFSDGHDTGIYSWSYLRSIDPNRVRPSAAPPTAAAP